MVRQRGIRPPLAPREAGVSDQSSIGQTLGAAVPAAALALLLGCAVGAGVGYVAHATLSEPTVVIPPAAIIKEEISDEDLATLCEDLTEDEASRAREAQGRVESLQSELEAKEAELAQIKKDAAGDEDKKAAARKKWREMEAEIEELRGTLEVAEQERDQARKELKETIVALDKQIKKSNRLKQKAEVFREKAKEYKEESTQNLWSSFRNDAKVQICDRGSRKRHENCHAAVDSAFGTRMRDAFSVCVDTYQAVPVLKQAEKDEQLPQFAKWLPDDNKFTKKNWYVIFCDPTLPEAGVDASLEAHDADIDGPEDTLSALGIKGVGDGNGGADAPSDFDDDGSFDLDDEEDLDDFDIGDLDP